MVARPSPSISRTASPSNTTTPGAHPGATFDTVTPADLRVLSNPRSMSGFNNVYACENKGFWRARVLKNRNLRRSYHSPTEAATAVILWYKRRYREKWVAALHRRKAQGWHVERVGGGYAASAFVGTWMKTLGVFTSRGEAVRVARAYAARFQRGQVYRA